MEFVEREEDSKSSDFSVQLMTDEKSKRVTKYSDKSSMFPAVKAVVLKLFAPAAHFVTFPNFAAHLDQSADLFWSALSFPRFPLSDAL